MQYLSNYFKQIYQKSFQRKNDVKILSEIIASNSEGLFFASFQTHHDKITLDTHFGLKEEISYSTTHVFFGNCTQRIAHLSYTTLPYKFQQIAHTQEICQLDSLPLKIKEQILNNCEKIKNYKNIEESLDHICNKIKTKPECETFSMPANPEFYRKLHVLFFKNKIENTLKEKPFVRQLVKV